MSDPNVQQLTPAYPVGGHRTRVGLMAIHAEGVNGIVVQGTAVGLAERGNVRPLNEPAKAGHLGPTPGARARPRQLHCGGVDAVGTHENITRCDQAIRK